MAAPREIIDIGPVWQITIVFVRNILVGILRAMLVSVLLLLLTSKAGCTDPMPVISPSEISKGHQTEPENADRLRPRVVKRQARGEPSQDLGKNWRSDASKPDVDADRHSQIAVCWSNR